MLNSIRGKLKGVIAWIFVLALIPAFGLVGVQNITTFQEPVPIQVAGQKVSRQALMNNFNQELLRVQRESNRAFTREEAVTNGLPERVVADVTARTTVMAEAQKMGLTMPRSLVREVLGREEIFQNKLTGKFDRSVLLRILQANGISIRQFDAQIREDLLRQNIITAVAAGPQAPRSLTDLFVTFQTERRDVTWLSVTSDMGDALSDPTPEDLQSWYEDNPAAYTAPEYRTLSVAFMRNEDFREGLSVPEDELRTIYDNNKERLYEEPEKRTLRQLTYENEADALAATSRLKEGVEFEVLAAEKGLTLAAATLEETTQAAMINQEVAAAAFAEDVKASDILEPVKGLFGSTVVQIISVTEPVSRSFEEVRSEIETAKLSQDTQRLVFDAVDKIEEQRDEGISLEEAAKEANIKFQTFGPVDQFSFLPGGGILDGLPNEALREGFQLDEGEESESLDLGNGQGYLIISVDEITPPTLKSYEEVAEQVEAAWRQDVKRKSIEKITNDVIERMENGETLETIAQSFERASITETLDRINPRHETISESFHRTIFEADKDTTVSGNVRTGDSKIVARINDISFSRGNIQRAQISAFQREIGLQLNQELLDAYIGTLQQEYDVKINQNLINQMFSPEGS